MTLDLHANEDHELSDAADAVFIIKRYPHYDAALQGERAMRIMLRQIKGTYKPTMATRKPGVLTPSVYQGTGTSPAMEIMERARIWEERRKDVFVSVAYGFAYADVPDVGATVMVVTNNDQKLADQIADGHVRLHLEEARGRSPARRCRRRRKAWRLAIAAAKAGKVPVVVADHSDRTGNSTHILEELIRQGGRRTSASPPSRTRRRSTRSRRRRKVGDRITRERGRLPGPVRRASR